MAPTAIPMITRGIVRAGCLVGAGLIVTLWADGSSAQECKPPRVVQATVIGMKYCADPAFDGPIAVNVTRIRQDIRAQRQAGKLIIYASTPISPRGGGHEKVNLEIAGSVKARLEKEFGATVWVLNPGEYQLPPVDGKAPGGGEYMVMWTQVMAGENGQGRDLDMVHFTGPGDMRAYFGCGKDDVSGCLGRYVDVRAGSDAEFRQKVADDAGARAAFLRYYALRASAAFSTGARDEWNIVVRINRKRPIGDQLSMFFDGRPASPAEMEVEVGPGYEVR